MHTILCFGDSNTFGSNPHGGRWPRSVRWTGLLQQFLGSDYYVIEEGLGGRNTIFDDPLEPGRNGLALLPVSLNSHKPLDLVVLSLGTNDCKVLFNANPKIIAKGLENLIKTVQTTSQGDDATVPKILVISPITIGKDIESTRFASYDYQSYEKSLQLAPLFEKVAQEYGCLFLDASTVANPSETDQLHMEAEDHEHLAKALLPIIKKQFNDERETSFEEPIVPIVEKVMEKPIPSEIPEVPTPKKSHAPLSFRIPGFSRKKEK
ncbi:SGNH/GDSL hydrolase family protein [uncultured Sphaerochaeta sp.]|uniref:SGNH/GDSL hydrolase family protein n=1 Tax=uncultured Sphaerochaeta sp. TaxID=886478 RepID=UPI002A0A560B|nr:SGNH/GDSL hydrolase family protein [uncultured Sphaerochaeta sp.]